LDEGYDPCMHVIRVFDNPEDFEEAKKQMEESLPYRMHDL